MNSHAFFITFLPAMTDAGNPIGCAAAPGLIPLSPRHAGFGARSVAVEPVELAVMFNQEIASIAQSTPAGA
jgi:hypothetical protein